MTDVQRCSLDKPLLLWLWPSPQSSLVLSAWKRCASIFPMQKAQLTSFLKFVSEIELQDSLHYSILGEKPVFTLAECVLVNIWNISSFSQTNNFVYACVHIVLASKAIDFSCYTLFLCTMCLRPHCGCRATVKGSGYCAFTSQVELPLILMGVQCGIQAQEAQEER